MENLSYYLRLMPKVGVAVSLIAIIGVVISLWQLLKAGSENVIAQEGVPIPPKSGLALLSSIKINFFAIVGLLGLGAIAGYLMYMSLTTKEVKVPDTSNAQAITETFGERQTVKIIDNYLVDEETSKKWQELLRNVPTNPNRVVATASSKTLESGKSYPYPNVTFTWSGEKANEPGTKIIGYYVYFGPNDTEIPFPYPKNENSVDPKTMGKLVKSNSYTATGLEPGRTYNLYVQSVSDSKNNNPYYAFGLENVGFLQTLSAKKLFTYFYNN